MMHAGGITPVDLLNNTVLIVIALLSIIASTGLAVYDRRSRRREVGASWEERADDLTKQLSTSYNTRIREKDAQIAALTKDRDFWRDRWMGRPGND